MTEPRTLVLGLSERVDWPAISIIREFESAVCRAESADYLAVSVRAGTLAAGEAVARNAVRLPNWHWLAGRARDVSLPSGYDLLVAPVMSFRDLWVLAGLDLSRVATTRICYIDEIWPGDLRRFAVYKDVLEQFDAVYVAIHRTVAELGPMISTPVAWLPSGTDVLQRMPPDAQQRCTDVISVGRRCAVQHAELVAAAEQRSVTYAFDSLGGLSLTDWYEHRLNLAGQAQRSTFYVTHRAKFDSPEETGDADEFGGRFMDAMASGNIPIGDLPRSAHFRAYFPSVDGMVRQDAGQPGVVDTVRGLLGDPDRVTAMSSANLADALDRHDWLHRWAEILAAVGHSPTARTTEILGGLGGLAGLVRSGQPTGPARTDVAQLLGVRATKGA